MFVGKLLCHYFLFDLILSRRVCVKKSEKKNNKGKSCDVEKSKILRAKNNALI